MKKIFLIVFVVFALFLAKKSFASPGDYSLRFKGGPAFNINDYENQIKFGGQFDYDLGFGWGVGLEVLMGVKNNFLFQLMPEVKYTCLYIGPAELFFLANIGYEAFGGNSAFGMRFGSGITLPLGSKWEVMSDFSLNITPAGTAGTPTTLDWLIGFGRRFGGPRN